MRKTILFLIIILTQRVLADDPFFLNWETAWCRVLNYAPALASREAEVAAFDADTLQASLLPNPIGWVESENLGIHNHSNDAEPPETSFGISQLIELGGKRGARRALASSVTCIASLDVEVERQNLKLATMAAFIDVSVAQERLALAQEREEIGSAALETVCLLLDGGKASELQEKKARVELMGAQLLVREALSALMQARKRLSNLWGSPCPDFDGVDFPLHTYCSLPCQEAILENLIHTADYARAWQEINSLCSNLRLQKANSIPDVAVTFGYSIFHESGAGGWLVGVEMPFPIFNRNQGNIRRAAAEISRAEFQLDETMRALTERVVLVYERAQAAYDAAHMIHCGVLAEAKEAYDLIQEGYSSGKLGYLELLDARKTLFEIEENYLSVLHAYHQNLAELTRLTGEY